MYLSTFQLLEYLKIAGIQKGSNAIKRYDGKIMERMRTGKSTIVHFGKNEEYR